MIWNIEIGGEVALWLEVTDGFLQWLRPQLTDTLVASLDPYINGYLQLSEQQRWLQQLQHVERKLRTEAIANIRNRHRLPQDKSARASLEALLADRELKRTSHWKTLTELHAALELAIDQQAIIKVFGD